MREISPATSHSCEEFLRLLPPDAISLVERIRSQKRTGARARPSNSLLHSSHILSEQQSAELLDRIAALVDENLFGRAEMCEQFASLLARALQFLGIPAQLAHGDCTYYRDGKVLFSWKHYWVRIGSEVVDGNTDILHENPAIPEGIAPSPYWGPITEVPADRRLRGRILVDLPYDPDVETIWWPELKCWLAPFASRSAIGQI